MRLKKRWKGKREEVEEKRACKLLGMISGGGVTQTYFALI